MYCPNCHKETNQGLMFCPNCGTRLADGKSTIFRPCTDAAQPTVTPAPKKQTFLGVFSFILSLYCAWSIIIVLMLRSGMPFGMTSHADMINKFIRMACISGLFMSGAAAIMAICSLLRKNGKKGLGTTALILSLISLLGCILVFVTTHKTQQPAEETGEAIAVVSGTEAEPVTAGSLTSENVVFELEPVGEASFILTVDNQSERDVSFGWVDGAYALLTTDQGTYRCDIGESMFNPVRAYTKRTVNVTFDGVAGQPQKIEFVNLMHLDKRGLPSKGMMDGIVFQIRTDGK